MKQLLLLLSFFTAITAAAQDPKDYHWIPKEDKQLIFSDEFDDYRNDWHKDSKLNLSDDETADAYFQIANGLYIWKYYKDGGYGLCVHRPIDYNRDFEINFYIHIEGKDDNSVGAIIWGQNETNISYNTLSIHKSGRMVYFYCNEMDPTRPCPDKAKHMDGGPGFANMAYNLYTIRKHDKFYYIFINGQFWGKAKYTPTNGTGICIVGTTNTEVVVDFLKIYYLPD